MVLGVLALLLLEMVALAVSPVEDRVVIGGSLIGAAVAAFVIAGAMVHSRRSATRRAHPAGPVLPPGGQWYGVDALEGFPAEALGRLLPASADPHQELLHTAWVLANHGRDAAWISHHLDLPADVAHLLVDTAKHRGVPSRGMPVRTPPVG